MTKNKVILILAIITITLGLIWIARNNGKADSPLAVASALRLVSENNYDFGKISMKDGNVNHSFILKNEGDEAVTIKKIWTSCMCTEAILKNPEGNEEGTFGMHGNNKLSLKVNPGEKIEIEAVYNPNAHGPSGVGPINRIIYLETNSSTNPRLELKFKGIVVK